MTPVIPERNIMKLDILKSVVTLAVSAGIGAVVTNAVKATTPEDLKTISKVLVVIGTVAASRAVSDTASTYTEKQIDELSDGVKKFKAALPSKKN